MKKEEKILSVEIYADNGDVGKGLSQCSIHAESVPDVITATMRAITTIYEALREDHPKEAKEFRTFMTEEAATIIDICFTDTPEERAAKLDKASENAAKKAAEKLMEILKKPEPKPEPEPKDAGDEEADPFIALLEALFS